MIEFTDLVRLSGASATIRYPRCDSSLVVKPLFSSVVKATFRIQQKLDSSGSLDASADGRFVIAAASADVILGRNQQLGHPLCPQVSGHHEVPDLVAAKVRTLPRAVSLMPIGGNQDPSMLPNFWEERFVG